MTNVLEQICADKLVHIALKKAQTPLRELEALIEPLPPPKGFIARLEAVAAANKPALIAEVKKASPSKGVIRPDFDPERIARIYEDNGAACLSVLTDEPYFQGRDDYLRRIRRTVSVPLLRKDFMLDPYQVYEARALGADCILLIMAALGQKQAAALYTLAAKLGLDVLIEVHDAQELNRALELAPRLVGVNSRNLKTLEVDFNLFSELSRAFPAGVVAVAESGIGSPAEVSTLRTLGYKAFLVGESLMRQADIGQAVRALLDGN